jgi:Saccharopine dehydrogenase NADP binding domain
MRVVVIGGLGNFGARICRRLSQEDGFKLVASSRRAEKSKTTNQVELATLDIDHAGFAEQLKLLAPDLVIHCAGPFQNQDYRVALAALAGGAHYIDIADGRAFVGGFAAAVQSAAKAANRLAITGASTLPALSSAVVDSMRNSLKTISSIARWAPGLNRVGDWLNRFGSGTGGMKVRVVGIDSSGHPNRKEWQLLAEDNHGPEIPCMAAVLLAMKLRRGGIGTGAKVCVGLLSIGEFEGEFARWGFTTHLTDSIP